MAKIPLPHYGYDPTDLKLFGLTFRVQLQRDDQQDPPWERSDGHGVVTDWIGTYDRDEADKRGLRVLHVDHGGSAARYYDFGESLKLARKDGWGLNPEEEAKLRADFTQYDGQKLPKHLILERAVQLDYEFIRDWCHDRWEYVGVVVTLPGTNIERSVWGIESNATEYLAEVACELAGEIARDGITEIQPEIQALQKVRVQLRRAARLYGKQVAQEAAKRA